MQKTTAVINTNAKAKDGKMQKHKKTKHNKYMSAETKIKEH